jgi:hypothetical protein
MHLEEGHVKKSTLLAAARAFALTAAAMAQQAIRVVGPVERSGTGATSGTNVDNGPGSP